jgi:hypothetical protein
MPVRRHAPHKHPVAQAILLFIAVYLIALPAWLQVMQGYAEAITLIASKIAAGVKGIRSSHVGREGDVITAVFTARSVSGEATADIEIPVPPSSFTFNVPLTLGILASLSLFIARKARAYGEAILILVAVHFLYAFSRCTNSLTLILVDKGLEAAHTPQLFFYQFLWGFADNMIIRFEPFLIGLYLFMRFHRRV